MKASIKDRILLIVGCAFLFLLVCFLIIDATRRGIYSVKMGINVAIVGDSGVSLLLLRPEEGILSWVKLPSNVMVDIYNSDASYPLDSLWKYGEGERRPFEVIENTLGQSMEIVVSRTIKIAGVPTIEDVLGDMLSLRLKTDLSIRDRLMMRKFLVDAVKSKKVLELSIPKTAYDKVVDPDGAEFLVFNETMGLWTKNKFVVESILNENASVSINNISGVSGRGNTLADQLESTGMHVVEVKADLEESVDGKKCIFYVGKRYEMTERVLVDQLGCSKTTNKPSFVEDDDKVRIWVK